MAVFSAAWCSVNAKEGKLVLETGVLKADDLETVKRIVKDKMEAMYPEKAGWEHSFAVEEISKETASKMYADAR